MIDLNGERRRVVTTDVRPIDGSASHHRMVPARDPPSDDVARRCSLRD